MKCMAGMKIATMISNIMGSTVSHRGRKVIGFGIGKVKKGILNGNGTKMDFEGWIIF